jgi:DNA-binding NarL/FixJ family response regulator
LPPETSIVDEIPVFLALTSSLVRARMRASLTQAPGIRLIGEADTAIAAAEQLPVYQPRILLTEQALLQEPSLLALLARPSAPHVVLVTLTDHLRAAGSALPRTSTLPFTLTPPQLAAQLRRVLAPGAAPVPPPPAMAPELRGRFHFTGPEEAPVVTVQASQPAPRPVLRLAPQHAQSRRRPPSARQEQLVHALQALQQQRQDPVTGLAGPPVLEQAWALLPTAQQAVAVVAVEVQDERGTVLEVPPPEPALLRRVSATLQANVRREDLVCRAGPATFVIILPGVGRDEASAPVGRVRTALAENCRKRAIAAGARLALGVRYWEAGQESSAMVARRPQALRNTPLALVDKTVQI